MIWGFAGCWRFLTRVQYLYLDLYMFTGCWWIHVPNFGSLDFEVAKNIHVLKVLIWGFGGFSGFPTEVWHPDLDMEMVTCL